jgi:POT family proton-dependent oligopeptide transporter
MGINLGAFSPLIVGWVGEKVNWRLGFATSAIGMLIGVVQYLITRKYLGEAGRHPTRLGSPEKDRAQKRNAGFLTGAAVLVFVVAGALNSRGVIKITAESLSDALGWFLLAVSIGVFAWMIFGKGWSTEERKRAAAIFVLFIASCVFWGAYEQAGSSLNLFAERNTNRHVLGYEFPASWFQWVQPLFVLILAPLFAWLWLRLGKREPSSPAKFSVGLLFVGLSFLVLVPAAGRMGVSPNWLNFCYFLSVVGEMCLSPVGLSAMTKLAPVRAAGFVMGVWFLSLSIGDWMAGRAGSLFESMPLPKLFSISGIVPIVAAVILALLVKPTKRLMSGIS